ncbi:MAG: prolyl oligopeptidase family serine peptidase [Acidimicrobiales bacterium]
MSESTSNDRHDRRQRRPIRPADLCRLRSVTDVTVHPDSTTVVYAVGWPDAESDANRSQLYAVEVDGGTPRQLTHGHNDRLARFSADGRRLAFVRTEPKKPATVMVLHWPVGEIVEVAQFADGVDGIRWLRSPAGSEDRLVVLAAQRPPDQEGVDDDELARRPRILTSINYRFNGRGYINDRPRQLFLIADPTGPDPAVTAIGAPGVDHGGFDVSPVGDRVAAVAVTDDDADLTGAEHVWLYTVDGAADPVRLTETGGQWESVLWHPDGTLIATGMTVGITGFHKPFRLGLPEHGPIPDVQPIGNPDQHVVPGGMNGNAMVAMTRPAGGRSESGSDTALEAGPGSVLFPGVRSGRTAIDEYRLADGCRSVVHEGPHEALAFDASADGTVVVAAITTTERPAELWRVDGEATKLVSLNDDVLGELDLATTEVVSVTSDDGTEVQAFIIRPPASAPKPDRQYPGLVYVHGGPMFHYGLCFFDEFQMAAACGNVVIAGNPRGSDGHGEAWAQAIAGDLGNKDWADVSALADHLQSLPEVDPERVAIGGGSYGGFMTSWALGHDQRFKAGLVERAVTSWNTMYGTSDIGNWFTERTIGATIELKPEEVTRQSPLHYAAQITAPTLILHSEEDWRCPIEQAEQLFAAIRRSGGQATMVRFPEEDHGLSRAGKPSHRIERFEIIHEFFAQHIGGADFGTSHLTRHLTGHLTAHPTR